MVTGRRVPASTTFPGWLFWTGWPGQVDGVPPGYGLIVIVPSWHRLIRHVARCGALTTVETMALAAGDCSWNARGDQGVSPDAHFVAPDRRAQRIAYTDANGIVNTIGLRGETLLARHRTAPASSRPCPACRSGSG